jgi:hypothetical protein
MDLPSCPPAPRTGLGNVAAALDATRIEVLAARDGLALFGSEEEVRALKPDFARWRRNALDSWRGRSLWKRRLSSRDAPLEMARPSSFVSHKTYTSYMTYTCQKICHAGKHRSATICERCRLMRSFLQNQIQIAEFMPKIALLDCLPIDCINGLWCHERRQQVEMACFRFM